jgi:hypothetical protein
VDGELVEHGPLSTGPFLPSRHTCVKGINGKRNAEHKPSQKRDDFFVSKRLPEVVVYRTLISKIGLFPTEAAAKVIRAYAVIEEFPVNLWLAVHTTREGEIKTNEIEDFYHVRSQATAQRVAELYEELLLTLNEAIEESK